MPVPLSLAPLAPYLQVPWLLPLPLTPENPPVGPRLSCPAQAILTSTLLGVSLQVRHVLPGHLLVSLGKFCGPLVVPGLLVHGPELVLTTHSHIDSTDMCQALC